MSQYTAVGWQDSPSTATPIDASNLGNMDAGIDAIAKGTLTLTAGHQETGETGGQAYTLATDQLGWATNFKNVMTNVPSSITLTRTDSVNTTGSISVQHLSVYGFWSSVQVSNSAQTYWNGLYATVGNCLLAVYAEEGEFDHHCDICQHVALDVPLTKLQVVADPSAPRRGRLAQAWYRLTRALRLAPLDAPAPWIPGVSALTYTCEHCGAMECFATALTAADELDKTVMANLNPASNYRVTYGEQARRVRALLRALGKPLIEDIEDVVAATLGEEVAA